MKYYISIVLSILVLLSGISLFFPVKDGSPSSNSGWSSTLSQVSAHPHSSKSPTPIQKTTKPTEQSMPSITRMSARNTTPTKTNVLGAKATPTPQPTPTTTPTPIPLFLTLTQPTGDIEVSVPTVTIIGKTVPNAEVFVNDLSIHANAVGIFITTLSLDEGDNLITVSANDPQGTYNEKEIVVTYNKP